MSGNLDTSLTIDTHQHILPNFLFWMSLRPDRNELELRHAMTCKIERVLTPGGFVVLRVIGRIDGTSADVLQELTENEKTANRRLALDLTEVTVVSLEAVRALTVAEASGIELRNCPTYVREWISQVRKHGLPE